MKAPELILMIVCLSLASGCMVQEPRPIAPDQTGRPGLTELRGLAEKGDPNAALALGMRYRDGRGVRRDYAEALKWYRRCADTGDRSGMDNVGFMYLRGWGVPEDFHIAVGYFKAGAGKGDDQAAFNLGNCYFSGQGVEQDYRRAIDCWRRAAGGGNHNAIWRLACLHAAGEGVPRNREKARVLCRKIADKGEINGMLLLGELRQRQGDRDTARKWWAKAAQSGSVQAKALLGLSKWRDRTSLVGRMAYVEVDHLYQGWNNCGATSAAMLARHGGSDATPYDIKRLCPQSPIATGTDWADLLAAGAELGQRWKMLTFTNDDAGFSKGLEVLRSNLDARRPVVIDFTVTVNRDGQTRRSGHTLMLVGYRRDSDQFVLKNPNQPPPGIQIMSSEELKASWFSIGYSRLSKGRVARPLIVMADQQ